MEVKTSSNSRKRKNNDEADVQLAVNKDSSLSSKPKAVARDFAEAPVKSIGAVKSKERCLRAQNTEDYVNFVGDVMYPKRQYGPYGFSPDHLRFPVERVTSLGYLLSTLRRPTAMEKWSPFEVAVFEASMTLYGKNFSRIQKHVSTKTVQDIIEFYYEWKKTSHYKQWKKNYVPDERDIPTVIGD